MDPRQERHARIARMHDLARERAQELRRQAIVDFWRKVDEVFAAGWKRLVAAFRKHARHTAPEGRTARARTA